jgi:hypothetical protein
MRHSSHLRSGLQLKRLPLWVGVASVMVALGGGCCGGRLVSVQLYDCGPQQAADACLGSGFSGTSGHFRRHQGALLADPVEAFRGPALVPPHPRFHPVPTQPAFEPRVYATPLKLLDPPSSTPHDSTATREPTPATPPLAVDPPA